MFGKNDMIFYGVTSTVIALIAQLAGVGNWTVGLTSSLVIYNSTSSPDETGLAPARYLRY